MMSSEDYTSGVVELQHAINSIRAKAFTAEESPTGELQDCSLIPDYDKWGSQKAKQIQCRAEREAKVRRLDKEAKAFEDKLSDLHAEYKQQQEDQLRNQIREFTFEAIVEASKAIPQEEIIPAVEEVPVIPVERDRSLILQAQSNFLPEIDTQPIQQQSPQSNALPLILGGLILLG